jgi:hypothetical protein
MQRRQLISTSAVAGVAVILSLTTVRIMGQTSPAAPKTATAAKGRPAPRTAWGKPDLQGVWDFRTVTPLERPTDLAGKQLLNDREAADFESQQRVRNDRDRNVPAGNVGDYNQFWYDRGERATSNRTSLITDPPDGRIPALTAEAQRHQDAAATVRRGVGMDEPTPGGWVHDLGPGGLRVRCILGFSAGPPMTPSAYNNNVQIFQTQEHVVLLNEMIHDARVIPLDSRPHGTIRQWAGDSRARWDGNTLVVDTINFHAPTLMTTGELSITMHLTERFTRVDADTLQYEFTIDDPRTWTKPWTAQIPMMRSKQPMYEYACHEGNYGLYNILAGARAREEAESKKGSR